MIRDTAKSVARSVARSVLRDSYLFRMTFQPGSIPAGLVTTIAGVRQDYLTAEDEANEVLTDFPANTPVITYKGLKPEEGNSLLASYVSKVQKINERISTRGTALTVSFTATSNSTDIVGTVQIFGPIYANASGLILDDGALKTSMLTGWQSGDVIEVIAEFTTDKLMRIGRI